MEAMTKVGIITPWSRLGGPRGGVIRSTKATPGVCSTWRHRFLERYVGAGIPPKRSQDASAHECGDS